MREASLRPDRVRGRAAMMGAWAGSGWTGASAGPCDLAVASPVRSARQTFACRHASSGGRRKCCSRFPLYAPWTYSSGCTSPVIRGRSTQRLTWGGNVWPPGCRGPASNFTQHKMCCCSKIYSRCLYLIVAVLWIQLHKQNETVQHTTKTHGDLLEVNIKSKELKGPLSGHQCN